jgi:hypothetical protein
VQDVTGVLRGDSAHWTLKREVQDVGLELNPYPAPGDGEHHQVTLAAASRDSSLGKLERRSIWT